MKIHYQILIFLLFWGTILSAQVASVSIGIDGLHCSACSFGTEQSLRKLDFVDNIKMDLNTHIAEVSIKAGKKVDFVALAKKVVDAGFSVRSMYVIYDFNNLSVSSNFCYDDKNLVFSFIGIKDPQVLNGKHAIHLVGSDFMTKSENKKWKLMINNSCNTSSDPTKKVYQVTL